MSSSQSNDHADDQFHYGYHLVAFFDLLGQRELVQGLRGILENEHIDQSKLIRILKSTVGTVWSFRDTFATYYSSHLNHKPDISLPPSIEKEFKRIRSHEKLNLYSFSDSTIAWSRVQPKDEYHLAQNLNTLHAVLSSAGLLLPIFLSKGVPFRGGIDLEGGIQTISGGNEIYGPALNSAYHLESKCARYPRVLVGPGVTQFLEQISETEFENLQVKKYCELMVKRCKDWLFVDVDDQTMVHFLGPISLEALGDISYGSNFRHEILQGIWTFISESEKKFSKNRKLRTRYRELRHYYLKQIPDKKISFWRKCLQSVFQK